MNLSYFVTCDAAAMTKENKMVLHGIFDTIFAGQEPSPEAPVGHPSMAVAFEVVGLPAGKAVTAVLELTHEAGGDPIFRNEGMLVGDGELGKHTAIFSLNLMRFPRSGKYQIALAIDGKVLGTRSLLLKVR